MKTRHIKSRLVYGAEAQDALVALFDSTVMTERDTRSVARPHRSLVTRRRSAAASIRRTKRVTSHAAGAANAGFLKRR